MQLLRKNPAISVEMDGNHQLIPARDACDYSDAYSSIIACGQASIVQKHEEIRHGLNIIMRQAVPGKSFSYRDNMMKAVCVVRIECDDFSCRQH